MYRVHCHIFRDPPKIFNKNKWHNDRSYQKKFREKKEEDSIMKIDQKLTQNE